MKFLVFALIVALAFAAMHPVNEQIVNEIKEKAKWTPMPVEENPFAYLPVEQIKAMMGTKLRVVDQKTSGNFQHDDSFDARKTWGKKVHSIRDQGQCGSCWAFGATEALSDRFAIEQDVDVVLSPQYLVSCDQGNYGCMGGYLDVAWEFMETTGTVTDDCYKYTSGETGKDGDCPDKCADGSDLTFYHAKDVQFGTSVDDTMDALQHDGPVEAAFTVYEDFMNYQSGIYEHTSGSMLGGHAIKAVGWGTDESGTDYWIMANSWGTSWGMDGFFMIKRGDCGIDGQMTYGLAGDITSTM